MVKKSWSSYPPPPLNKKKGIDPASLPPTSNACKHHSLRAYHQAQSWLGQTKDPLQYGWKNVDSALYPVTMDKSAAPDSILSPIKCGCKTDLIWMGCSAQTSVLVINVQALTVRLDQEQTTVEMQPTDQNINSDDHEEIDELHFDFGSCSD